MAPRIGFTLAVLRRLDPKAEAEDVRLAWKDGDGMNIGILQPREEREDFDTYFLQRIRVHSPRELRLLGLQMIKYAEVLERPADETQIILP